MVQVVLGDLVDQVDQADQADQVDRVDLVHQEHMAVVAEEVALLVAAEVVVRLVVEAEVPTEDVSIISSFYFPTYNVEKIEILCRSNNIKL